MKGYDKFCLFPAVLDINSFGTFTNVPRAVDATARNLAFEWGTGYIRLNRIASGSIGDTPGFSREKRDIAMAALYFASDAGKFINGASMVVDGGLWMSCPALVPKDTVRWLSRTVEKRSRDSPVEAVGFDEDVRKQEDAKRAVESTFKQFSAWA
ncbi:hypothetical protein FNV43_RR20151 [Rhamnella rubrinervis]|uniref:SDR family oxidoreductase n=1 Tax=Rhamnella rubrinervis TaxID=2594499 RepID=A0A8K0GUB8_9ROSA|nr:hypothetical protein FNV43_RR20151 [Rhamnella rubrinervis]